VSRTLVLTIPEEAYEELLRSADAKGQAPEDVATEILAWNLDPLMRLAGSLSAPVSDIGDRHDEYIGEGLLESCRDSG
jgi:hypothetical protein